MRAIMGRAMKFGVLGTGVVGKALGKGFVTLGHEVKMGSRSATNEKALAWANEMGPKASAGNSPAYERHEALLGPGILASLASEAASQMKSRCAQSSVANQPARLGSRQPLIFVKGMSMEN
jgi:hypothetical protein